MAGYITIKIPKLRNLIQINPILKEETQKALIFIKNHKKSIVFIGVLINTYFWRK
jgi:hypothetical protein